MPSLPVRRPELHEELRRALKDENYEQLNVLLSELRQSCHNLPTDPSTANKLIDADEVQLWFVDVARLLFLKKGNATKVAALEALEAAIPFLESTKYHELPVWQTLRAMIGNEYTALLDTARSEKDPNWHRVWSALVRVMHYEICQGSTIINLFLSIVEAGFRSPECSIREQSFDCWRLLVEVFAQHQQLIYPKRIRLICIPLKSSKSKTELIARKKFDIWWFLMMQLQDHLEALMENIFEPFIYFCFGPSFKPPLCYYFDESYQEYGAPGKTYQSIKQLSAIALIHLLGPVPEVAKTLLTLDETDNNNPLVFACNDKGMAISTPLFRAKVKLLLDSCTECMVLFSEMKHLNYLELNRCLWRNFIARAENLESRGEVLQWFRDDMTALLNLVCKGKSKEIVEHVFDLKRYCQQQGYWEMLQKTIQFLCDPEGMDHTAMVEFSVIRTHIYCHIASGLVERIKEDPNGFDKHRSTVMNFLLYPLEFDQLMVMKTVQKHWIELYRPIVSDSQRSCEFANGFCEMIKAMTVAKYSFNFDVVADYVGHILSFVPGDFDTAHPPQKVIELFKDLTRKGLVYKTNLDRLDVMLRHFRELVTRMSKGDLFTLIMPIRHAIGEMVANEQGLAMAEIKRILNVLAGKFVNATMMNELQRQPSEIKWNCKMLLKAMLDLPMYIRKHWKQPEIRKCMDICDGIQAPKQAKSKGDEEFVVINSVWNFKPDQLTEHQLEKMKEKRSDIPALYNDMSQSQDSFVIKPWTPTRVQAAAKALTEDTNVPEVVSSSADIEMATVTATEPMENPVPDCTSGSPTTTAEVPQEMTVENANPPDKENNYANMVPDQPAVPPKDDPPAGSESDNGEKSVPTKQRKNRARSALEQLRIDTVAGKSLDVMNMPRTRHSEVPGIRTRRKALEPKRKAESEKKRRPVASKNLPAVSASVSKDATKTPTQKEGKSSRKNLNFEKLSNDNAGERKKSLENDQSSASEDVIESSQQATESVQSIVGRKVSLRRSRANESQPTVVGVVDTVSKGSVQTETSKKIDNINKDVAQLPLDEPMEIDETKNTEKEDIPVVSTVAEKASKDDFTNKTVPLAEKHIEVVQSPKRNTRRLSLEIEAKQTPRSPTTNRSSAEATADNVRSAKRLTRLSVEINDLANMTPGSSKRKDVDNNNVTNPVKRTLSPFKKKSTDGVDPVKIINNSVLLNSPKKMSESSPLVMLEPIKSHILEGVSQKETKLSDPISQTVMVSEDAAKQPEKCVPPASTASTASEQPVCNAVEGIEQSKAEDGTLTSSASTVAVPADDIAEPLATVQLSPVKDLDVTMEPLDKSQSHTIVSSPDLDHTEERAADLLNNTLNISPIAAGSSSTNDMAAQARSADRRSSSRIMDKEREPVLSSAQSAAVLLRRSKASPQAGTSAGMSVGGGLKKIMSTAGGTPRSPSTNLIGMGGRGAHLINLIRNQQNDSSPKPITPPQNCSTPNAAQSGISSASRMLMRKRAIIASATSVANEGTLSPETGTKPLPNDDLKEVNKQYLVFSKVLPSPQASPAVGILKRRHCNSDDSDDENETPANKRKRVSFHDPPVSVTKEYLLQEEECRTLSPMRCPEKTKFKMRRRSRTDSISELESFTQKQHCMPQSVVMNQDAELEKRADDEEENEEEEELTSSPESLDDSHFAITDATDTMMSPLQVSAFGRSVVERGEKSTSTEQPVAKANEQTTVVTGGYQFASEEAILEHVLKRYTLDDMVERYLSENKSLEQNKTARSLAKQMSSMMMKDTKVCHIVLDELSERHSVDFLDHAIQENSSAMVCQRLSTTAMIDHIFKTIQQTATSNSSVSEQSYTDTIGLVHSIVEKLNNLPPMTSTDGQTTLAQITDGFVRQQLAKKSRLEMMALLEDYFKQPGTKQ
uniref:Rif1_N domain-containing protein n=1 Tax=Anopheles albimanus TaxID=7167 RepID=A0A182FBK9_ANOAL